MKVIYPMSRTVITLTTIDGQKFTRCFENGKDVPGTDWWITTNTGKYLINQHGECCGTWGEKCGYSLFIKPSNCLRLPFNIISI